MDKPKPSHKRTTSRKEDFLKAFENSRGMVARVRKQTKISRATYYNWLKTDPAFSEAVDEARSYKADLLEEKLHEKALGGDMRALLFMLKYIHPSYKKSAIDEKHVCPEQKTFEDLIYEPAVRKHKIAEREEELRRIEELDAKLSKVSNGLDT